MKDNKFTKENGKEGDLCIRNPRDCPEGFSLSFFYQQPATDENYASEQEEWEREYLISTGGDEKGYPGVSIWFEGADLGVVVSTGNHTWSLNIRGQRPLADKSWTNIALRWLPLVYADSKEFIVEKQAGKELIELGGLEVFMDMEPIGYVLQPQEIGCTVLSQTQECDTTPALKPLDPMTIMMGCHQTSDDTEPRYFAGGGFDELAIWTRALNDTDLPLFFGGYSKLFIV